MSLKYRIQKQNLFLSIFYILCLLLLLNSCNDKNKAAGKKPDIPVQVDILLLSPQSVDNSLEASGTIIANEAVDLHAETSGRLTYLFTDEGKFVTAGTTLAKINDADLVAQQNKILSQLELAKNNEQRLKKLIEINGINQNDYDAAVNTMKSLESDLAYNQALLDKTIVRAPFSGVVGLRQVSPGAYITPQNIIATLQQTDKLKVDFTLPDQYASSIHAGTKVIVEYNEGTTKQKVSATIVATEPRVSETSRNIVARAVLEKAIINPGTFVKVYVSAGLTNGILIPSNSIIPEAKNKKVVVMNNGKAAFKVIQTGMRFNSLVQVTDGLTPGDSLLVTGVLFVKPGSVLTVNKIFNSTDSTFNK